MIEFSTEQEGFWAGSFGDEYTGRNSGHQAQAHALMNMARRLRSVPTPLTSVLELGANRGLNLAALRALYPQADIDAVEINPTAAELLRRGGVGVHEESILDFEPGRSYDLVLLAGVLIHIEPSRLGDVYDLCRQAATRYVLISEYYNPVPVEVPYRGHRDRLFKRDFAGEMLDRFPASLELADYGFIYHRDPFPADDTTWFLLKVVGDVSQSPLNVH